MTLEDTLNQAWALLTPDAHGRGRTVSLASVDTSGHPQARTVMLRGAVRPQAQVTCYTDLRSAKVAEFRKDPRAAILLWSDADQVQIRLTGRISVLGGEPTKLIWATLRPDQKLAYGHDPAPGSVIDRSDSWSDDPNPANLAVLSLAIERLEHVSLDAKGHRRALFERSRDWNGQWLSP